MSVAGRRQGAVRSLWGWRILIGMGVLLLADGLWLLLSVGTPSVFQQDTGVSLSEVQAAYPTVVAVMASRGSTLAVLVMGLGVVTLVNAFSGLRHGSGVARAGSIAVFVTIAALSATILVNGSIEIGLFWAFLAIVYLLGTALTLGAGRD